MVHGVYLNFPGPGFEPGTKGASHSTAHGAQVH